MFDNQARDLKEKILAPIAAGLSHVHPTVITFFSLGCGLIAAGLAWQQWSGWSAFFWAVNRLTDGLDGTMARLQQKQSDLGGYLDILADFTIYALLPIALVLGSPSAANWVSLAFLLMAYYVNAASWMYLSALLEKRAQGAQQSQEKTSITMPPAVVGGLETTVIYFFFILWPAYLPWLFGLMTLLVWLSIGQRLVWAGRNL